MGSNLIVAQQFIVAERSRVRIQVLAILIALKSAKIKKKRQGWAHLETNSLFYSSKRAYRRIPTVIYNLHQWREFESKTVFYIFYLTFEAAAGAARRASVKYKNHSIRP